MKFQVSYRFFGATGKCIRGGEAITLAENEAAAIQWFKDRSIDWPEWSRPQTEAKVDATRMITNDLGWDEGVEAMARVPAEEWEAFIQAVKTERGLSG